MKSLSAFEDLSVEDKAKVVGGLVAVGVGIVGVVVFMYFFAPEYGQRLSESLNSGSSIFTVLGKMMTR